MVNNVSEVEVEKNIYPLHLGYLDNGCTGEPKGSSRLD